MLKLFIVLLHSQHIANETTNFQNFKYEEVLSFEEKCSFHFNMSCNYKNCSAYVFATFYSICVLPIKCMCTSMFMSVKKE